MKNTFGNSVTLTVYGESHGKSVGIVIDGLAPGIKVDNNNITRLLTLRRPYGSISTARTENDEFSVKSGVYNGYTTGTPICIDIENRDTKSQDYSSISVLPRPGHADYTAAKKYHGYQDPRGGGHFSGRITAGIVAAAGILIPALERKGIIISTHIKKCAKIEDVSFDSISSKDKLIPLINRINEMRFPVIDDATAEKMKSAILKAKENGDSIGGVIETIIIGLPSGIGEPWFNSMESMLSHVLFSIPAVKGVEFGDGFLISDMYGSEANDQFDIKNGEIFTVTNHNGGINGGITNGMPVIIRTAVKPTPSISKEQNTVNLQSMTQEKFSVHGRHDPFIAHRARIVADSLCALVICDLLTSHFGTDYLSDN